MTKRIRNIALTATAAAAMILAIAAPAGAQAAAAATASRAATAAAAGTASTLAPVNVTGDITWTADWTYPNTTGGDDQTGTFHIDLTNVNGSSPASNSTFSISNNANTSSGDSRCTTTDTGSSSSSGPLPLASTGSQVLEFQVGPAGALITIGVAYAETDTVTETGSEPGCNITYTFSNPGSITPICYNQNPNPPFGPGTFEGTYPNGTVSINCSGTSQGNIESVAYSITGTLTVTPSCGSPAVITRGQGIRADASACGLTITSPPADSIIAATDGTYVQPQPGPNDRQPDERDLIVEGTAPPTDSSITLNGQQVPVSAGEWTAKVPVGMTSLGQLTLTASDPNGSIQETITLIDLEITVPTEGTSLPITAEPAMPDLNATLSVPGYPGDTSNVAFDWTLDVRGETVTRPGTPDDWHGYSAIVATGTTTGTGDAWQPKYDQIVGGVGRMTVTASLPGVLDPVTSEPRWINVPGSYLLPATAKSFVDQHVPDKQYADTIKHIICVESSHIWQQFNPKAVNGEVKTNQVQPPIPDVPADWQPNPGAWQPLYGSPAGIGIAQLDQKTGTLPLADYWNWQVNLQGGIHVFYDKLAQAHGLVKSEQRKLDRRLTVVLAKVNADRKAQGLSKITKTPITVPALPDQGILWIWQAIRLYNGGNEFHFDADYVVSSNGLKVDPVGTDKWIGGLDIPESKLPKSPAGSWGKSPDLSKPRPWIPVRPDNLYYVGQVLKCTPA
jgi:hypothetical protein